MPTFSWPRERLLLLIAGGEEAMVRAVEGAEDEVAHARELVKQHRIHADDVLVAVAASGTTPFTLSCLREAKRCGAFTIGIANNRGTPILAEAEQGIFLNTGAEPIAGSTRMNAGTAQRITLNLLSTLVMIRLGHVYRGLMVDVQASNVKLSKRKAAMVAFLTGMSEREAEAALAQARGSVKVAVLVLHGCDARGRCYCFARCRWAAEDGTRFVVRSQLKLLLPSVDGGGTAGLWCRGRSRVVVRLSVAAPAPPQPPSRF